MNVVHPRPVSWEVVLGGVREELGGNLPFIPLAEWVAELEARSEKSSLEDLSNIVSMFPISIRRHRIDTASSRP